MHPVYSSGVTAIGHDSETNEMHVTWNTGRTSVYQDVPPEIAEQARNSWSVGKFLRESVRDKFQHRYSD